MLYLRAGQVLRQSCNLYTNTPCMRDMSRGSGTPGYCWQLPFLQVPTNLKLLVRVCQPALLRHFHSFTWWSWTVLLRSALLVDMHEQSPTSKEHFLSETPKSIIISHRSIRLSDAPFLSPKHRELRARYHAQRRDECWATRAIAIEILGMWV
jgi:hypothetical protein